MRRRGCLDGLDVIMALCMLGIIALGITGIICEHLNKVAAKAVPAEQVKP